MRPINPVVMRCSSCKSECRQHFSAPFHVTSWRWWVDIGIWLAVFFTFFAATVRALPWGYGFLLTLAAAKATSVGVDRVYHWLWLRRHPLCCDGNGHAEPVAQR